MNHIDTLKNQSETFRPEAVSPETIKKMFGSISGRYDLTNSILSVGIHHHWRTALVRWSGVRSGGAVLDCATGTGDLAFQFERATGRTGRVVGTDFCDEMLIHARIKARNRNSRVLFEPADVTALPYSSASFDLSTISFGIRNVADPLQALKEMGRVTRPGGAVLVLEFGQSRVPIWKSLFGFYSTRILPMLGGFLTGKKDAYLYLQDSSSKFPCREAFLELGRKTELFDQLEFRPLMGGIAYIYKFRRSEERD